MVSQLSKNLLGQSAIDALGLVLHVGKVDDSSTQVTDPIHMVDTFPNLFKGLGRLEGEYTIKLEEGAQPYALSTPRRVPIPLMKAVKDELERMQTLGVIVPVNGTNRLVLRDCGGAKKEWYMCRPDPAQP